MKQKKNEIVMQNENKVYSKYLNKYYHRRTGYFVITVTSIMTENNI